jgi:ABC-type glycerol-3-phosphate transport system permease component
MRGRSRSRNRERRTSWGTGPLPARGVARTVEQLALLLVAFVSLAPLYAMAVVSLKPDPEFRETSLAWPHNPTLSNFSHAWGDLGFSTMLVNSVILSLVSALVITGVAALAGFAYARMGFRGRRPLLITTIALMAVPAVVIIVPLFKLMSDLRMINTYPAAILIEVGVLLPFAIYLMYSFLRELPPELFKAAAIDGAGTWQQFRRIVLPLSRPALATTMLTSAVFAWNDLLIPLIFWPQENKEVLMVGLSNIAPGRGAAASIPVVMAAATISVLPLIILFVLAQRSFIRGLTEGALK